MAIAAGIALGIEGLNTVSRFGSNIGKEQELDRRGVNVPFHQKLLQDVFGPIIGSRLRQSSLDRKLARTGGPVGSIPTRGVLGLEGDSAFADTARAFREQLSRQTAGEISNINREFSTAGRFASGQRLSTIERAQEGARQEFGRFLGSTSLERFLQQQRLQTQADIAQAQIESQRGSGRLGAVTNIAGSAANIFAQSPEARQWLVDLFTKSGGEIPKSGFYDQQLAREFE